ncbi:MAG: type 4a pilus biogenesis protein PilO [Candidatus Omnitrophota bacterium]
MDLGIFLSTRKRFLFFILAPILSVTLLYLLFNAYYVSVKTSLDEKQVVVMALPVIVDKISRAQGILDDYYTESPETDVIKILNYGLNEMGSKANLNIQSLKVQKNQDSSNRKTSSFKIDIKAEGSIDDIVRFFKETYRVDKLFVLDNVALKMINPENNLYSADFVFIYSILR